MDFTHEQRRAIDTRDRTLLVSAAAGSGKTATMTERIISSLTARENPASLARLVIATFTVEAAGDMKKKIGKRLAEAIERDPDNQRLRREELLLPSARISTIDAFCLRLLRQNADKLGLPPSFRISDSAEGALLSSEVLEALLEDLYAGLCPEVGAEEFCLLADTLSGAKSESDVSAFLLFLYERLRHEVKGLSELTRAGEGYRASVGLSLIATRYGEEIALRYAEIFEDIAAAYERQTELLSTFDEPSLEKRIPFCLDEAKLLLSLAAGLRERNASLVRSLPTLGRIPGARANDSRENGVLSSLHTLASGKLAELQRFFAYRDDETDELCRRLAELCDLLFRVLSLFDARLSAEKRRRRLLDFLDIERLTHTLLLDGDGNKTPLAAELAAGIDGIYIDEFQDVNALQYDIFRAIARDDNLFMVGDVKQCIYAFRFAEPAIFSALRAAYPPMEEATPSAEPSCASSAKGSPAPASLFFTKNFRSDRPIISYVNRVAGRLLAAAGGSPYTRDDELSFGKVEKAQGAEPVTTHIFELPTRKKSDTPLSEEERAALSERESRFVAAEISRLLAYGRKNDGSPIRPSDIVLLFRNKKAMAPYLAALEGIAPLAVGEDSDFFQNPEVLLALSLLYIIDNPRRDIYLAAALRSPVFGMSLTELSAIRREAREASCLFDALVQYAEAHAEFKKGKRFLSTLASWRRRAEGETVGGLVLAVFEDAGLMSLSGKGSSPRHDNLYRFYQYARSFEASSYEGLYSFIAYINAAIQGGAKLLKPAEGGGENAVRLTTIHASKGLEFPVVFLCAQEAHFNDRDSQPTLLYDRTYGPVVRLLNERGDAAENPIRLLCKQRLQEKVHEEEIRLLYVALTRARERLYVTGSLTKPEEKMEEAPLFSLLPYRWRLLSVTSPLGWILPLLAEENDKYLLLHPIGTDGTEPTPVSLSLSDKNSENVFAKGESKEELLALLRRRLAFSYPDKALTSLPEKLSVSDLSPRVLDGEDGTVAISSLAAGRKRSYPRFLSGAREDEGALRGTATHLFMQFCDYRRLAEEGAEAELSRLVREEFITPEDAALVRMDEIDVFLHSSLFARLLAAKGVRRELRFHALLPAARFTEEPERRDALAESRLLVQGVIDCIIEEDGYTVIDYKTDRLTADELASREAAAATLIARHGAQLSYYAAACREMYGEAPRELLLYSLPLGDTVPVPLPEQAPAGQGAPSRKKRP